MSVISPWMVAAQRMYVGRMAGLTQKQVGEQEMAQVVGGIGDLQSLRCYGVGQS